MRASGETKFFIGIILITVAILVGAVFFFSKPAKEVPLQTLIPENAWATGSATAKATLVEFADFQCPACGTAHPVVQQVIAKYPNDLRYVFRHFPLDQHENARLAAQAAEAAGAQDKFWQMHNLLFENQTNLSQDAINGLGIELKLDMEKFTKELTDKTYLAKVEADLKDGQALGVSSTPTFFLNGKKLSLFSFADLDAEIQKTIGTPAVSASPSASQ